MVCNTNYATIKFEVRVLALIKEKINKREKVSKLDLNLGLSLVLGLVLKLDIALKPDLRLYSRIIFIANHM